MMTTHAALLENETLTPAELMQVLRTSRSSVYRGLRNKSVPHFKFQRRVMIPTSWLRALLTVAA